MSSVLGTAKQAEAVIEVILVNNKWLVRTMFRDQPPSNHQVFYTREAANEFAAQLCDVTSDMMERMTGSPALLKLAEADDGDA